MICIEPHLAHAILLLFFCASNFVLNSWSVFPHIVSLSSLFQAVVLLCGKLYFLKSLLRALLSSFLCPLLSFQSPITRSFYQSSPFPPGFHIILGLLSATFLVCVCVCCYFLHIYQLLFVIFSMLHAAVLLQFNISVWN